MTTKKPRISLTKTQIQAGVGAELLTLCQTFTSDGSLSTEEINELIQWLSSNRKSDLPAIEFLVKTVDQILADGKVTPEERKELYNAIEKVLPPEARKEATGKRKAVEAEQKAQIKQERETEKQREREERERQKRLFTMNFMVAGIHYEGRWEIVDEYVNEGDTVFLARDPLNKFSKNAIEIRLNSGMQIGFVPEDYAPEVAPLLDQGCPHIAFVTKILRGGRVPIPVVQAYVHRADANIDGLVFPKDLPAKRNNAAQLVASNGDKAGCASVLILGLIPLSLGGIWVIV
jgi:hypothetical protein